MSPALAGVIFWVIATCEAHILAGSQEGYMSGVPPKCPEDMNFCLSYCLTIDKGTASAQCGADNISCICTNGNGQSIKVRFVQERNPAPPTIPTTTTTPMPFFVHHGGPPQDDEMLHSASINRPVTFDYPPKESVPYMLHCDESYDANAICHEFCITNVGAKRGVCQVTDFSCRCEDVPLSVINDNPVPIPATFIPTRQILGESAPTTPISTTSTTTPSTTTPFPPPPLPDLPEFQPGVWTPITSPPPPPGGFMGPAHHPMIPNVQLQPLPPQFLYQGFPQQQYMQLAPLSPNNQNQLSPYMQSFYHPQILNEYYRHTFSVTPSSAETLAVGASEPEPEVDVDNNNNGNNSESSSSSDIHFDHYMAEASSVVTQKEASLQEPQSQEEVRTEISVSEVTSQEDLDHPPRQLLPNEEDEATSSSLIRRRKKRSSCRVSWKKRDPDECPSQCTEGDRFGHLRCYCPCNWRSMGGVGGGGAALEEEVPTIPTTTTTTEATRTFHPHSSVVTWGIYSPEMIRKAQYSRHRENLFPYLRAYRN